MTSLVRKGLGGVYRRIRRLLTARTYQADTFYSESVPSEVWEEMNKAFEHMEEAFRLAQRSATDRKPTRRQT